MPIINFLLTLLVLYPWVKHNILYILLLIPIYIIYLLKGIFTYLEFINDLKK